MRIVKILFFILTILFTGQSGFSQTDSPVNGTVSYKSGENVYVRFESTEGINPGDTLFLSRNGESVPALIVEQRSSISCVCKPIGTLELNVSDNLTISPQRVKAPAVKKKEPQPQVTAPNKGTVANTKTEKDEKESAGGKVYGKISVSSYSDFNDAAADNHQRMRYTFSLHASKIGGSKLSFESYMSFRHNSGEWDEIRDNIYSGLKMYNLSLNYAFSPETNIWLGRKINPKVSSIGAIDGIQFEKRFNGFTTGVFAGSRPDWTDYSYDPSLFQAGIYVAHDMAGKSFTMQNTLSFVEQENDWKTDRRFIYIQHTDRLFKKIYFFGSAEFDIYKKINDKPESTFDVTNLYFRLRYRITERISMAFSYSARNNIILYESFKSFIDRLLEQETLQGYTLSANVGILKNISIGARAGYRDRGGDIRPSKNLYTYINFAKLPLLGLSSTINAIFLETSYLKSNVYGIRLYRGFAKGKITASAGYKYVNYDYNQSEFTTKQNIAEINLGTKTTWDLFASVNFESTFEKEISFYRIYINLTKRF